MCVLPWIIEREELDWKCTFTRLNAGFASSMPLLRTVRSKSCCFGHTRVQARLNGTRGEPPMSIGRQVNFFLQPKHMLLSMTQEQNLPLWAYTG